MTLAMSSHKSQLNKFSGYINTEHSDRKFIFERGRDDSVSFRDNSITHENKKLVTSGFCETSFSRLLTNFNLTQHIVTIWPSFYLNAVTFFD